MKLGQELLNIIKEHSSIVIFGHKLPDGDCFGCQVGLKEIIKENYHKKDVYVAGSGVKSLFPVLGYPDKDIPDEVYKNSLAIIVDCSAICRVEDSKIHLCKEYIKIDHHKHNEEEDFPHPYLVQEGRIAAGEIIVDFALAHKLRINVKAARALYVAILTDSGNLKYYGTTPHTFDIINFLLSIVDNPKECFDAAFYVDEETKRARAYIKNHIKIDGQVAYCIFRKEQYEKIKVPYEIASSCVNTIGTLCETNIYVLFAETPTNRVRVEFRSNQMYPVNGVAMECHGGGHRYAAGCEIENSSEAIKNVLNLLNKVERDS
ncbi:MAG: bifunctional oligoribonuclease/PAP phosphatase NrnA [Bacilli bacterium]|nr:bifunctional oligoribonuclease/PAP phosphatase NrnA [Bacilli bacterium]MDY6430793.1 bifunctional oligoribonuclease/PAP phosphatase NrnA [Bacilli bacterium]